MSDIVYKTGAVASRGKVEKVSKLATVPNKGKSKFKYSQNVKESFLKRIQMCSVTYDYSDNAKDVKGKSERLTALQELRDFFKDMKNVVSYVLPHLDLVLEMIRKNIFRPLPMEKKSTDKLGRFEPGDELAISPRNIRIFLRVNILQSS